MMLKLRFQAFFFLSFVLATNAQVSWNVELFAQVGRGDTHYSGSWAYVAPDGKEYALIGAKTGTAAYPIDDPGQVTEAGFVPGPETNWREITVIGQHAFVVTDVQGTGHSLQVIDLGFLPDSLHLLTSYTATFTKGHIIQKAIDNDDPIVYVMGTNTTQGVHIIDVSNPAQPTEVGVYAPGYYIHDAHIRGNLLFAAAFYKNEIDIVDISDKTDPKLTGKVTYNGKNTHSASSTPDGKYLIVADEADGYPARIFHIGNIENPVEVAQYTANSSSLVHNPYVRGLFCFVAHNTEGLRVIDIADPELPVEVGYYDTWSGPSGGFQGLWSACPYLPSGKVIGGNRHDGLYVWTFNQTKAARIYGIVRDSLSHQPLPSASIQISQTSDSLGTNLQGHFKKGLLSGHYSLLVSAQGYESKGVEIDLEQGDSLWLEIPLASPVTTPAGQFEVTDTTISVSPNPFSQTASVDLSGCPAAHRLVLFDLSGKFLWSKSVAGERFFELKAANLGAGKFRLVALDKHERIVGAENIFIQP